MATTTMVTLTESPASTVLFDPLECDVECDFDKGNMCAYFTGDSAERLLRARTTKRAVDVRFEFGEWRVTTSYFRLTTRRIS